MTLRLASILASLLLFACGGSQSTNSAGGGDNPCGGNPCEDNPCGANPCGGGAAATAAGLDTGVDFSGYASWTKVNSADWVSKTHGKEVVTGLYLNGNAEAYKALSGDPLAKGFAVAKAQHKNNGGAAGDPSKLMVMVKMEAGFDADNGDWYYGVLSYDGTKVMMEGKGEGKTEMCANCHTGAKHDYLFGSPN